MLGQGWPESIEPPTRVFAVRATASTGFRAPTRGQVNTLNITTSADTMGNLIPTGTYSVNHPEATTVGSIPLTPEESTSFTLGAVFLPFENTSVTLDFYDIEIADRLIMGAQALRLETRVRA